MIFGRLRGRGGEGGGYKRRALRDEAPGVMETIRGDGRFLFLRLKRFVEKVRARFQGYDRLDGREREGGGAFGGKKEDASDRLFFARATIRSFSSGLRVLRVLSYSFEIVFHFRVARAI